MPSEMLTGSQVRTKLDLAKPSWESTISKNKHGTVEPRSAQVGQKVVARCYGKMEKEWKKGIVMSQLFPVIYKIQICENEISVLWKWHID